MDKQESAARLLLAQRKTTWDALKQWNDDLNKLIYWLALLCAAATAAASNNMPFALVVLVAALPAWLYMYLRASYWYRVNLTVLEYVERRLNSSVAEQGESEPLPKPALVQARAGCDGNMALTGPLRAPWLALAGSMLSLGYILLAELHIKNADWQGYPHALFLAFCCIVIVGAVLEFVLFCKYKMPKLEQLPHELAHGFATQKRKSAHNTTAQADSYAAA